MKNYRKFTPSLLMICMSSLGIAQENELSKIKTQKTINYERANIMDLNRIDKELKRSMENVSFSLELDTQVLRQHPEVIQQERKDFVKNHPVSRPESVNVTDFLIKSSEDGGDIRLRVYQHKEANPNSIILYFHGGGYVFGLPEQVEEKMFDLVNELKNTIVSVDYRLSPQYGFPVPILDGFDALKYIINNGSQELNINPKQITVMGASAGGHLAASVAQMAVDNNIHNIVHQVLIYPVVHNRLNTNSMNEFFDSPLWNKGYAEIAWEHFLGKENKAKSIRYADLTNFDKFEQLPSATIVTYGLDPLRDEGIEYACLLLNAKVKTELWTIPNVVHVFDMFPSSTTDEFNRYLIKKLK